jgi:CHASE2 domain-containing sensor protein
MNLHAFTPRALLRRTTDALPVVLLCFASLLTIWWLGFLERPALRLVDLAGRHFQDPNYEPATVVVALSDADLADPRYAASDAHTLITQVMQIALDNGAKLVVNEVFTYRANKDYSPTVQRLTEDPRTLFAKYRPMNGKTTQFAPPAAEATGRAPVAVYLLDNDLLARRLVPGWYDKFGKELNAPFQAAQLAEPQAAIDFDEDYVLRVGDQRLPVVGEWYGDFRPNESDAAHWIRPPTFKLPESVQLFEVLDGTVKGDFFKDRVVFVGKGTDALATAVSLPSGKWHRSDFTAIVPVADAHFADGLIALAQGKTVAWRALPMPLHLALMLFGVWAAVLTLARARSVFSVGKRFCICLSIWLATSYIGLYLGLLLPVIPWLVGVLFGSVMSVYDLFRSERHLKRMTKLMTAIIDQLPEPIFVTDGEQRFRIVNEAFCRLACAVSRSATPRAVLASR